MEISEDLIILISSDLKRIPIKLKAIKRSKFLKNAINDFPGEEIPIKTLYSTTLYYIKEYLEYYENKKPKKIIYPLPKKDFKECVEEWDYNFINVDIETIYNIMVAANFFDIKSLVDLTAAKIASMIRGKSPKEIRDILKINNESKIIDNKIEDSDKK